MLRAEFFELRTVAERLGGPAVYGVQFRQRGALTVAGPLTHHAGNFISRSEAVFPHQFRPDVDVSLSGRIARFLPADKRRAVAENFQNSKTIVVAHLITTPVNHGKTAEPRQTPPLSKTIDVRRTIDLL